MQTELAEKRANPRAQYFLVRKAEDYVPVFSFRSESDPTAIAAVVTDLSEGGVQILSAIATVLTSERYKLTLVIDPRKDIESRQSYDITKVWSRMEGVNVLSGFSFAEGSSLVHDLQEQIKDAEYQLIRCTLHAVV